MKTGPLEMFQVMPSGVAAEDYATVPPTDFGIAYWFWCEGCEAHHRFVTKWPRGETGPTWTFNGDVDKPTFSPSYLANGRVPVDPARGIHRCHLYMTDGVIRYLDDCTHALRGKTVVVPPKGGTHGG